MKLHLSTYSGNVIRAYGEGFFQVGETRYPHSLIVTPETLITDWRPSGFAALSVEDFARLVELKPEIAVLGTGLTQRFPQHALLRPLVEARIGWEIMDTGAACRTYNVLASEGRRVAAALLLETC